MESNEHKEIDLTAVDWNNLSTEEFASIYGKLADRSSGSTKRKAKPKLKAEPKTRVHASLGGQFYLVLEHQLKKFESIENSDEKAEYKKILIENALPIDNL